MGLSRVVAKNDGEYPGIMPELKDRCARCRHAFTFHSKGTSHCKATGCKAHAGRPCPEFVPVRAGSLSSPR